LYAAKVMYEDSVWEVDHANAAHGNRIGLTRDQLEGIAQSSAASANISVREATSLEARYLATGGNSVELTAIQTTN
jgi:hypothetical protein